MCVCVCNESTVARLWFTHADHLVSHKFYQISEIVLAGECVTLRAKSSFLTQPTHLPSPPPKWLR